MKHTKGPWKVIESKLVEKLSIIEIDGDLIFAELSSGDSVPTEEHKANARLIAAAPDLLEACKAAKTHYAMICEVLCANNPPPGGLPILEQLKQAIAKAEVAPKE